MRILDAALNASWAMEEGAARNLFEIAAREHEITPEALQAYRAQTLDRAERATERDGVAIITAEGPLFKGANLMTEFCGATSYDCLRRDLQTAVDATHIHSIMVNVDSPGGVTSGVGELASAIRDVRGVKPIVAYIGDLGASAAYWLASAADKIVIGESASVGSVGVRGSYSDTSKRDEASGVRNIEFVSSQSPHKATDLASESGRARIQARVDAIAQVFVDTVAANRGVSADHVLENFGKGDVLVGKAAVSAGMADEIGTFESTLAGLIKNHSASRANSARAGHIRGESAMDENDKTTAITAEDLNAARTEATTAERTRVSDIMALILPGYEASAQEAIKTGSSASDFAALIVKKEQEKVRQRAAAIEQDTKANEAAGAASGAEDGGDINALVKSIFASRDLASGKK